MKRRAKVLDVHRVRSNRAYCAVTEDGRGDHDAGEDAAAYCIDAVEPPCGAHRSYAEPGLIHVTSGYR